MSLSHGVHYLFERHQSGIKQYTLVVPSRNFHYSNPIMVRAIATHTHPSLPPVHFVFPGQQQKNKINKCTTNLLSILLTKYLPLSMSRHNKYFFIVASSLPPQPLHRI